MRRFLSRLRVRILLLVLLAVVPALALMLSSAEERRRQDAAQIQENAFRLSQFAANNLERDFQSTRELLGTLSRAEEARTTDPATCKDFYAPLVGDTSVYENVGRVSSDGTLVCSALPEYQGRNVADQNWFVRAIETRDFVVGGYRAGSVTGRATVNFGYPVIDRAGNIESVLFAAMDMGWLNKLAAQARLPQGATLTATDRKGTVLARYPDPEKWVGNTYVNAPIIKAVQEAQEEGKPGEGQVEAVGIDGKVRLYAFATVPGRDITVHVGFTKEAAFKAANQSLQRNLLAMAAVAVLALLAAWFIGDLFLMRQINALIAAVRGLGAGDLSTRTNMKYDSGELGTLAQAFDEMAESLEFRDAQLRESESERSSTESRFTDLVDNAPDAMLGVDEDGRVFLFNRRAEQLFGLTAREVIGQPLDRFLAPGSSEALRARADQLDATPEQPSPATRIAIRARRADGFEFPAEASVSRIVQDGRNAFTAIIRDTTDRSTTPKGVEG